MFIRYNIIPFIWIVIVSLLILAPGQNLPDTGGLIGIDKIAHTTVFGIEVVLIIVGLSKQQQVLWLYKRPIFFGILVCLMHNFLLEYAQMFIPDRFFDGMDMLANLVGVLIGTTIFYIIYKF